MQTRLCSTRIVCSAALTLLSAGVLVTGPLAPAAAQGARVTEPAGGFSYNVPAGWHAKAMAGLKYKICYTTPSAGFAPNINIMDAAAPVSLNAFMQGTVSQLKQAYTNLHVVSLGPFVTASSLHGMRLAITGTFQGKNLYQVCYAFPAANNRKIAVTASWLAADGTKYVAPVNAALKTFKLQ